MPRLIFHTGGPVFHPVDAQARQISGWLGKEFDCHYHDGSAAFDHLEGCDLFVLMGLHWPGMIADWAGKMQYHPMKDTHKAAFEKYITSGKPLLIHHGGTLSYNDWPRIGVLTGFAWIDGATSHSHFGRHSVQVIPTGHPVIAGVKDYTLEDELYHDVRISAEFHPQVHAHAEWDGQMRPMVLTAEGGRVKGAGRVVYLANGHDMKAFECPAMRQLWINSVKWLLV